MDALIDIAHSGIDPALTLPQTRLLIQRLAIAIVDPISPLTTEQTSPKMIRAGNLTGADRGDDDPSFECRTALAVYRLDPIKEIDLPPD